MNRTSDRPWALTKKPLGIDVLTAAQRRIRRVFQDFPNVYVSFSGGKDSGVLLELAATEARRLGRRLGVLIVDLEAQYEHTIRYLHAMLERHADVAEVYWLALPLALRNAVSQFQPKWKCWDPACPELWVREYPQHPGVITDPDFFPWFRPGMEFEQLIVEFGHWYADRHQGRMTACLVGIRADESLNRFRTIASRSKRSHEGLQWTTWIGEALFNAYPLYDWRTEDVWRFYGRAGAPYNQVYDLFFQAGLTIHQARLCQPYGDDQRWGLRLYHILEPHTWAKLLTRVAGANFGARYSQKSGNVFGRVSIEKPDGATWREYALALLDSMPQETAEHYRDKIAVFLHWYDLRGFPGGDIPDDGPLDKSAPSWKRIAKAILTYDYYCRSLSFSPPGNEENLKTYRKRMRVMRQEWGYEAVLPGGPRSPRLHY